MSSAVLPHHPDPCGWNALLPPRTPNAPASGKITAKYAVVGAGYTGLAAARRLAELDPTADIVVLEGTTVGEGASGRNSGFASPRDLPASAAPADLQKAIALNRSGEEGFDWLLAIMAEHNITCDLELTGRIKGAATDAGAQIVRSLRDAVAQLELPHEFLDTDQMQQRIGTRYYKCGLYTHEGYLLQPAALIRGLADSLPSNVRLHENSPVLSLRKQGKWHLKTPTAHIDADYVVIAANAAIKEFGFLRSRLVTIYTYAAITQALPPHEIAQLGSMANWGLLAAHRLGTTVRRVGPDRLMVRSLYAYERGLSSEHVNDALLSCFHRRYPALWHIGLDYIWGGTTALTMNGAPWWGHLGDGLYASAGCNGAGIVKGTVLGKRLAELIAGICKPDDIHATYGTANWVAPEPFRTIGFNVISAIERRKAGREA